MIIIIILYLIIILEDYTLFCSSKFSWAREMIPSIFIDSLVIRPHKRSPALL